MSRFAYVASVVMLMAAPAIAQTQTDSTTKDDAKKSDVNRIICQKEEAIGSRLGAKKVCLTAKEWKEREALSREETERVQQGTGVRPAG